MRSSTIATVALLLLVGCETAGPGRHRATQRSREAVALEAGWAVELSGGVNANRSYVRPLPDGGVLVAAGRASMGSFTFGGPLVTRLNARGEVVWAKVYCHTDPYQLRSIEVAPDGGFFLAGEVGVRGEREADALGWLLRADEDGNVVFQKTVRTPAYFSLTGTLPRADGGVIAVGQLWFENIRTVRILRFDRSGNLVGEHHVLRSGKVTTVFQLRETAAHGVVACGQAGRDALIVRLADDGAVLSSQRLQGGWYSSARDLAETPDGGLLVAAQREDPRTGEIQPWLVKLDRDLEIAWQRAYGGLGDVRVSEMAIAADGSAWVGGVARDAEDGSVCAMALAFGGDGHLRAAECFTPPRAALGERLASGDRHFVAAWDRGPLGPSRHVSVTGAAGGGCWIAARGREDQADPLWLLNLASHHAGAVRSVAGPATVTSEATTAGLLPYDLEAGPADAVLGAAELGPQPARLDLRRTELPASALPGRREIPQATALGQSQDELRARVVRHLTAGEFEELDRIADLLARTRARFSSGWWQLSGFYHSLDPRRAEYSALGVDEVMELTRAWLRQRPESIRARIALAQAYVAKAWTERGGGLANTVTRSGWRDFERWVGEAGDLLEEAAGTEPDDPQFYVALAEVKTLLGAPQAEIDAAFEKGVATEPLYDPLYTQRAFYLTEKWNGGPEQFSRCADDAVAKTRQALGEYMYGRMAIVAFQVEGHEMYSKTGLEWPRVRRGAEELYRRFPDPRNLHYLLMFACVAEDRYLARELFARDEVTWSEDAAEIWKSRERFEEYRTWASREMAAGGIDPRSDQLPALLVRINGSDPVFPEGDGRLGFLVRDETGRLLAVTVSGLPSRAETLDVARHVLGRDVWVRRWQVTSAIAAASRAGVERVVGPVPERSTNLPLQGLGLLLAGPVPEPPARPLPLAAGPYENERLYIVTCAGSGDGCQQVVVPVRRAYANKRPADRFYVLSLMVGPDELARVVPGAAVVDERGFAVAVVVATEETPRAELATVVAEEVGLHLGLDPGIPLRLGVVAFQDMVARLFLDRRFAEIDDLGSLALDNDRRLEGNRHEMAALVETLGRRTMGMLNKELDDAAYLETLEQWIAARPESTLAPLVLARFLAEQSPCPIGPVFEGLPKSRADMAQRRRACFERGTLALEQAPQSISLNPEYHLVRMQWEVTLQGAESDFVELYLHGVEVAPLYPRLHEKGAHHLAWLDSKDHGRRIPEVAEQAALHAPPELADAVYALVAIEAVCPAGDAVVQQYGLDWDRVRDGEDLLISRNLQLQNLEEPALRLACLMGDRPTARRWFQSLAPQWQDLARSGCWDEQGFEECRSWAAE